MFSVSSHIFGAVTLASLSISSQPHERTEVVVSAAIEQARAHKYGAAIDTLSTLTDEQSDTYDARFAKARILAWAGRHGDAEFVYRELLADFPDDPDIQVGYGQLAYYQADYDKSISLLKPVTILYPEYEDATLALERAYAAQRSKPNNSDADVAWRLDYGAEISTFDRSSNDEWSYYFAQASRSSRGKTFSIQAQHFKRFNLSDTSLTAGASVRMGDRWDASLQIEYTPDADFRSSIGFDLEAGRIFDRQNRGPVLRPYVRYSFDDYQNGVIHTLFPGTQLFLKADVSLDARVIAVFQQNADAQLGGSIRVSFPLHGKWWGQAGFADAPEAINGIVVRTRSAFGGFQYDVNRRVSLKATYARDDRENSFIRNVFSVSISHRF